MDATIYEIEDLLLSALKAENESSKIYNDVSDKVDNYLLKDKFQFLAAEENKHYTYVADVYKSHFPEKTIELPKKTKVPLPEVTMTEDTPLSKIITQAMNAEQAASEFYKAIATRFTDDSKIQSMLLYFADMELGHYKLLEIEQQAMQRYEEADEYWPMVHAGP